MADCETSDLTDQTASLSSRPPKRRKLPVNYKWLRRACPESSDVAKSAKALKMVFETNLDCCLEALASTRANHEAPAPQRLEKLHVSWANLLNKTYQKCAESVMKELGQVKLEPVYPELNVQEGFLSARKTYESVTTYTYHGTKQQNIDSISHTGLLMPGIGGHTVKNGSAHGVGIYTARLGSAGLSRGFCDSDQMFLCGVCDPSVPVPTSETDHKPTWKPSSTIVQTQFPKRQPVPPRAANKKFELHRKSDEVIHVGDAVVTFKQNLFVPLFLISSDAHVSEMDRPKVNTRFEAEKTSTSSDTRLELPMVLKHHAWVPEEDDWALPQQVATRQLAVPESDDAKLVRFGASREGQTVWIVEDPWTCASSKERCLKRQYLARQRDQQRRFARQEKQRGPWLWQ